jgi:hypothetical protein
MKKSDFILIVLFLSLLLFVGQVQAITVTDRWTDDLNFITDIAEDSVNNTLTIFEDYNEDNLIPYLSHDGSAVVDHDLNEPIRFFDKIIDLEGAAGDWIFQFRVHNTTPWDWSDYHFEFYDAEFLIPLDVSNILFEWSNTVTFLNSAQHENELNFWAPSLHFAGQTADYQLLLHTDRLPATFGIRQVATTSIPEPATLTLMCLALAGIGYKRHKAA